MGVTFRYTAMRLGIFVLVLIGVNALGAKGWLGLAIAAVVSVLLSVVLLRKQREQMAAALQQRIDGRIEARQNGTAKRSRFSRALDEDNAAED
ncbi:DUF4229 domain-containing protein [Kineococcus rhizosphaerae]|uniref:Uncharacterized protein DUF4229 n=1 Tax=Kineococcus rhizosphaerae TaxID=559628 RepID=A0A2T0R5G2_9ACTN|nr:DUF4229 domain-containing protein [Kineococcus rhizosphaerae]PRY15955.1 uncharacterized protein DUF4229 [Kineococcus rhizosphaerae]